MLASVVAAFYYLRIVKVMYFDEAAEPLDRGYGPELTAGDAGRGGVFIVLFFLYPAPILSSAGAAAASLFAGG